MLLSATYTGHVLKYGKITLRKAADQLLIENVQKRPGRLHSDGRRGCPAIYSISFHEHARSQAGSVAPGVRTTGENSRPKLCQSLAITKP